MDLSLAVLSCITCSEYKTPPDDPTVIHPHVVRIIGEGSQSAGRRVLEKFVQQVRQKSRDDVIEQPDGTGPSKVIK